MERHFGRRATLGLFFFVFVFSESLWALGVKPPVRYERVPEEVSRPHTYLEVVNYNVGNVGVDLRLPSLSCPFFKLCWDWAVRGLKQWITQVNADVILLQETMGIGQVMGTQWHGPLISTDVYEGECLGHTCVLWRKGFVQKAEPGCLSYNGVWGELLNCWVHTQGQTLQVISAYYPAVNPLFPQNEARKRERQVMAGVLFRGEQGVVDPSQPLIVGGDFNTPTHMYDGKSPYPPNFYTLFGIHRDGYGLSGEENGVNQGPHQRPTSTFFGVYEEGQPLHLTTHFAFGKYSRFDHMFANFGFPLAMPGSASCRRYACVEGDGGLPPVPELRPGQDGTDHEGIFARVGWENAPH